MVTVLKNVTNVITAVGEMYLFNKRHDNRVWAALFLMVCSITMILEIFFYNYFLRYQIRIKNNLMNSMLSFFQLRDSFLAMQDLVFLFRSFNFFLVLQNILS